MDMHAHSRRQRTNEDGFVLVTALLIMLVLTVIGIAMNRNTVTELQIAGNDRTHKQSFYEADGGTEFAAEVLEQNIACVYFSTGGSGVVSTAAPENGIVLDTSIAVKQGHYQFWQNPNGMYSQLAGTPPYPSDTYRDLWLPPGYAAGQPHTNITVETTDEDARTVGASTVSQAGYLGLGRSAAAGGITLKYQIDSQRLGLNNSQSVVRVRYHHVVGQEDPFCRYD